MLHPSAPSTSISDIRFAIPNVIFSGKKKQEKGIGMGMPKRLRHSESASSLRSSGLAGCCGGKAAAVETAQNQQKRKKLQKILEGKEGQKVWAIEWNGQEAKWNSSVAVALSNNFAIVQENIYQAGNWLKSVGSKKWKKKF